MLCTAASQRQVDSWNRASDRRVVVWGRVGGGQMLGFGLSVSCFRADEVTAG